MESRRRQVLEYIPFTNRIALVEEFVPSDAEQKLYNLVLISRALPEPFVELCCSPKLMNLNSTLSMIYFPILLTFVPRCYTLLCMRKKLTAIRLKPEQLRKLAKIAVRKDVSVSWLIRKAIDEFLKRQK
jgi:Ribbon-helix-helix protein, copG family